jgi:hypothetical protein
MSSDPSLLEDRTRALHMALRFGWVAAKGTGGLGCNALFMEHSIAWECSSIDWGTYFFAVEMLISPSTLPSVSLP